MKTLLFLFVIFHSIFSSDASAFAQVRRPNVLFISIDDMRPQIAALGHNIMVTPNLDKLASQSRLFLNHYAQVPTCGPSRACLLTGKNLTRQSEINHNHLRDSLMGSKEPAQPETFIHHFKKNGYHTVGMGKISHSESGHVVNRSTKTLSTELPHSWNEFVKTPDSRWGKQALLHGFAYGKNREDHDMPPFECLELADEDYPDGRLANIATDKLAELAQKDQAFLMAVGFYKPHLPFCAPKKYWDMYNRSDIPLSPVLNAPANVAPVFLHNSSEFFGKYRGGYEQGGAGKRLSDEYAREITHGYFASITYVDAQVGKVLDQLAAVGLDKNTIVIVWGDHGWHLGDHTIWGKHSSFDRALNALLMVKVPGMKHPGEITESLVASIDVYPTLCELTGLPLTAGLDGQSFTNLVDNPKLPGRSHVISFWKNILSVRTDRHRMALFDSGKRQKVMLFDLKNDPHESENVADQQPSVVERLTTILKENNKGFLPETGM